ncbi:MAG: hypothetical protein KGJ78_11845 [Alphaproteobacteria bacterium]|nr:hypothetical protein [Alphaproteobacteria bacterium]
MTRDHVTALDDAIIDKTGRDAFAGATAKRECPVLKPAIHVWAVLGENMRSGELDEPFVVKLRHWNQYCR